MLKNINNINKNIHYWSNKIKKYTLNIIKSYKHIKVKLQVIKY